MGTMEDLERKGGQQQSTSSFAIGTALKVLLLVLSTNIITIFLLSGGSDITGGRKSFSDYAAGLPFLNTNSILSELNSTQSQLSITQSKMSELQRRLTTANSLLETLLTDLAKSARASPEEDENPDGWRPETLAGETELVVSHHKLPFGFTSNIGSDEIYPSLGVACRRYQSELAQYMAYQPGGECPSDDLFAQHLMLKGCEPLPRRRCHPKTPANFVEPSPLPSSLWSTPSDSSITWDPYTCKNYECLVNRKNSKGSYDCKDCFDLQGREKFRWLHDSGELDYSIDWVLSTRRRGTVRIGLDIGGGTGTFAARMWERNVTIVTTTMNFDGPFNSFIASRGLVPLYISVAQRLPFFDNTLDIVHSMHVLSNWIPNTMLEFALFDIYRVLRPGGLFWLDHFFCLGNQLNATYVPIFDRIGYNKIRWSAGRKLDRGIEMDEWYLSALLEKPMT